MNVNLKTWETNGVPPVLDEGSVNFLDVAIESDRVRVRFDVVGGTAPGRRDETFRSLEDFRAKYPTLYNDYRATSEKE